MAEKINGIILNIRKYNDRNNIATLYTREKGRVSCIVPVGSGKSSNARRARLQPLSVISTEIQFKAGAELQRLGAFTSSQVWTDLYFHPAKRAMTLFVSEFLYQLLNASMPDPRLYDFLVDSLLFFDRQEDGITDFHIPFLVSLLTFSGIQPDVAGGWRPGYVFDFASGSYLPEFESKGPNLAGKEAQAVEWIVRLNFSNMKSLRLNSLNRRQILYGLLNYYSYHFPGLASLKTPEILRELFS